MSDSMSDISAVSSSRQQNIVGPVDVGWTVVTLKEYVDTLTEVSTRERVFIRAEIDKRFDQSEVQNNLIRAHYDSLIEEYDRRYAARFVASEQAVKDAFAAQEKAINAALAAQQAAVNKADVATEKRFDGVNEFRAQLGDQQRTYMPRAEVEVIARAITEAVTANTAQVRSMIPRTEHDAAIKALTDKHDSLVTRLDRTESRGAGREQAWGYVVAAAGVLIGIAGIVLAIIR
jgi:aspartyl-tRNA synthetase